MSKPQSTMGKFFSGLAKLYRGFRAVVLNLLFIFIFLIFIGSFLGQPPIVVQRGSALLINPNGTIVDQLTFVEPLDALLADSLDANITGEILLQDVLDAIDYAATDEAISSIVLSLNNLQASGFSKLGEIGAALLRFRESGKKVYAYGDNYSQGQYYLAAHADEVLLHSMGMVNLEGFSTYQYYYKEALDNLGVNVHIFRVGEYKSAVEPFERNDMSKAAREANAEWIGDLWQQYISEIGQMRDLEPAFINDYINNMDQYLAELFGDAAQLALESNLVDQILSRGEANDYLAAEIGTGNNAGRNDEFLSVGIMNYLSARKDSLGELQQSNDKVGLIVASGTIYDGRRDAGEIGGDSLQELISQARKNDNIKALVLRIDSGGGSAFASEVIRSELEKLRNDGKPLVVSMGSMAASGGYWISTPANEIWASASTITGSIGIFGLYPTFEDSFEKLGLNTDGIGTTELAGAFAVGRELPDLASNILQSMLEEGYQQFISLVAAARNMTLEEVDAIAQGRVWSGEDAFELGLVDNLGDLDAAIVSAAGLAELDSYEVQLIEQQLSPGQQLIQDLTNSVIVKSGIKLARVEQKTIFKPGDVLASFFNTLNADLNALLNYNDPRGLYLQCQECQPVLFR